MRDMAAGPRVLLKRLRELMAEALEPQERLDRIVHDIAQNMVAEVCSLYVLRADSVLELYATEGLNPGAVHLAQLRLGQGLVGTIAASARRAQSCRRAAASRLRLSPGNRRGNLQFVPWRAGAARRPDAWRPGRAEPHPPPLPGRRGRGAGDDGDGHRRDDRDRRSGAADAARASNSICADLSASPDCRSTKASALAMSCCTSRASSSPTCSTRTARRRCSGWKPRSARSGSRSTTCCSAAMSPSRASIARCSKPIACSPMIAAGFGGWRRRSATA